LLILDGLVFFAAVNGGVQINLVFGPSLGDRAISRKSRFAPLHPHPNLASETAVTILRGFTKRRAIAVGIIAVGLAGVAALFAFEICGSICRVCL